MPGIAAGSSHPVALTGPRDVEDDDHFGAVVDQVGDQARAAELYAPDIGIAGGEGPERVFGLVGYFCHCLDEAVECRARQAAHLLESAFA
jgi:hypothetical protein